MYVESPADIQHRRAERMRVVIQRFASTLCQREVRTQLVHKGAYPAWSTSNTISFVEPDFGDLGTADGLLGVKGLSLHEISHILFTPRAGSDIVRWAVDSKFGLAFNALEDQRIETLMVGRFGSPVVPWLTAVIVQHLVSTPTRRGVAFALIHGRKYLPIELRQACREAYVKQEDVKELSDITDTYRTFLFPQDTEEAKALIARYSELVKNALNEQGQPPEDMGGCGGKRPDAHDSTADSRPLGRKAQEKAKENAEKRDEEEEQDKEESFDFGNPNGGDSFGEDEVKGEGSGSSSEDEPGSEAPASEVGDSSESFTTLLNSILENVKTELAEDIGKDLSKLRGDTELEAGRTSTPKDAVTVEGTIDPATARASKAFGLELERLQAQFDPAWERQTASGRINAGRYLRGCELKEAFDRWTAGREDTVDIEAVILLDSSFSMYGEREQRASNAMWGLKRALDRVGASCTVVTFSSNGHESILYKADELATSTVKRRTPDGGTRPLTSIKYATRVLAESGRAVKVLFTITDGDWGEGYGEEKGASDKLIKKLRNAGVLTALAHIGNGKEQDINAHESEIVASVDNSNDLLLLGRQLVKAATQRNLHR